MKIYDTTNHKTMNVEDGIFLAETKTDLHIYDVFKYNGNWYTVCHLSEVKEDGLRRAGVDKFERVPTNPKPQEYSPTFVCPYCGYTDRNAWELDDNSGTVFCGSCGSEIEYERHVTIEYSTYPKNPPHIVIVEI